MNFKLVKLSQFSGEAANIYSIFLFDKQKTLFDIFIDENNISFKSEIKDIFSRLIAIGKKTGARVNYFTENEGAPGDGICALFDTPDKKLRLYCIRYGTSIVILGGGGHKPKPVRAFQEVEKLEDENYLLRRIARAINQRIKNKEISYTEDYQDFEGTLNFMKTKNKAEQYTSQAIEEILKEISPDELRRTERRMLLAARIDDELQAKGWKKTDFAREMKKSPSEISKWLSGTHNFTIDTLSDIQDVLGIQLLNLGNKGEVHYHFSISVPANIERDKWATFNVNENSSFYRESVVLLPTYGTTVN